MGTIFFSSKTGLPAKPVLLCSKNSTHLARLKQDQVQEFPATPNRGVNTEVDPLDKEVF